MTAVQKKILEEEVRTSEQRAIELAKSTATARQFLEQLTPLELDLLRECKELYNSSLKSMADSLGKKFKKPRAGQEVTKYYRCLRDATIIRYGFIPYQDNNNVNLVEEATKTS